MDRLVCEALEGGKNPHKSHNKAQNTQEAKYLAQLTGEVCTQMSQSADKSAGRKRLFVSACEPSSNLHLRYLAPYLSSEWELCGVFENLPQFPRATPSYTLKDFAVMGFFDVLKKLRFYKRAVREMSALAKECDCALLMDSSSFNIPIAKALKRAHSRVKVVYYILPQVWAWKPWRAKILESVCDELCAILPFELALYPQARSQGRARYVGHPLLDEIPQLKQKPTREGAIVFMPGSRRGEIKRIFPTFAKVARRLREGAGENLECENLKYENLEGENLAHENPMHENLAHEKRENLQVEHILVLPEHFRSLSVEELRELYGEEIGHFTLSFDANAALFNARFAFVCSGTATLQAVLIGTPLVLGYKTRALEVAIARAFVRLRHIGLANIFYTALHTGSPRGSEGAWQIHPELIQNEMTESKLLAAYEASMKEVEGFFSKAMELRAYLKHGAAQQVAKIVQEVMEAGDS